jgi:uncharacterized iron-regulated membrane protein
VLLCLSGITYLFKPQLDGLLYGRLLTVTPGTPTVSYEQQRRAVEAAYPEAELTQVATPHVPERSTQFDLTTSDGKNLSVFVNPSTGQVLGHRDNGKDISEIALALHGSLMTGSWLGNETYGDRFIELVAGWAIVLLVTGLYLWWPRGRRRGLGGVLVPRFRLRGRRVLWRDIHAVTGILFSFVTLFFLITGMAWTGLWGPKFLEVSDRFSAGYNGAWDGASSQTLGDKLPNGKSPWALGNLPLAPSGQPVGDQAGAGELRWDPREGAPLDAIVARAQQLGFPQGLSLTPPADETGSWTVGSFPDGDPEPYRNADDEQIAYLDQYTAEPLGDYHYGQFGPIGQATDLGISIHEGREWGLWSQLLSFLGASAILVSVASAVVMWRKRRPVGLGAPRRQPNRRIGVGVVVIAAALGLVFPLLGLSLLVVVALEFLVVRRVPRLARTFGAA